MKVFYVDPALIDPMPGQPRQFFRADKLQQLAASIDEDDQAVPVVLRQKGERYELVAGERRWRAVKDYCKKRKRILAVVEESLDDRTAYRRAVAENENREALHPLERARAFAKLIEDGATQTEVARIAGISQPYVAQLLGLLTLHEDVIALMNPSLPERDQLSTSAAIVISRVPRDLQPELAKVAAMRGTRVGDLVNIVERRGIQVRTRKKRIHATLQNRLKLLRAAIPDEAAIEASYRTHGHVDIEEAKDIVEELIDLSNQMVVAAQRIEKHIRVRRG